MQRTPASHMHNGGTDDCVGSHIHHMAEYVGTSSGTDAMLSASFEKFGGEIDPSGYYPPIDLSTSTATADTTVLSAATTITSPEAKTSKNCSCSTQLVPSPCPFESKHEAEWFGAVVPSPPAITHVSPRDWPEALQVVAPTDCVDNDWMPLTATECKEKHDIISSGLLGTKISSYESSGRRNSSGSNGSSGGSSSTSNNTSGMFRRRVSFAWSEAPQLTTSVPTLASTHRSLTQNNSMSVQDPLERNRKAPPGY
eukprot:Filipodium_phascolosomae@DN944_c0_g1_i1.p1